ncbi:MAG: tRNA (N(6)-L-threonylcarbamoyladenosine(37)-C(2))-methylthiotransferase MtaB, partial [Tannerella sp.]|nr:tRNA (N(6)-L-threonylcarbamoyladenosine(37)-C(2))-methylthiotransferase MtaB [Tannerella sp.]
MTDTDFFRDKTAAYFTLGCKLNFAETSTIGREFASNGIRKAQEGEEADFCVINTCSVTELADKKCRQLIRRVRKLHPNAFVIVTGCYAQLQP